MSDPFIGEIRLFSFGFTPAKWQRCDGTLLSISGNQALFSLIGDRFGGDGRTNFAVPDLRGRTPLHDSSVMGEHGGAEIVSLLAAQLPSHTHQMGAATQTATQVGPSATALFAAAAQYNNGAGDVTLSGQSCSLVGGGQAHLNLQPTIVGNYCMSLSGYFPSRP
jgi:microcystin-dependent protein